MSENDEERCYWAIIWYINSKRYFGCVADFLPEEEDPQRCWLERNHATILADFDTAVEAWAVVREEIEQLGIAADQRRSVALQQQLRGLERDRKLARLDRQNTQQTRTQQTTDLEKQVKGLQKANATLQKEIDTLRELVPDIEHALDRETLERQVRDLRLELDRRAKTIAELRSLVRT